MRNIKKYGKASVLIICIAVILGLSVYGLISLIKNVSSRNSEEETVYSPMPTESAQPADKETDDNAETPGISDTVKKEINVSLSDDILTIQNAGPDTTFTHHTGENTLSVYVPDCNNLLSGVYQSQSSVLASEYIVSEEKDGILISVKVKSRFNVNEIKSGEDINFVIHEQLNTSAFIYRNDLTRNYMTIQKARLSNESDSFIKRYSESFDNEKMVYTIRISKDLMPDLNDEHIFYNDGTLKSVKIINSGSDIILEFEVYDEIIIYPNTRDYDAAFTFIKPRNSDRKLIVIDAGHGGIDGGTVSADKKIVEKNLVLNMGKYLHDNLVEMDFDVINLREEDIFLGLMERTDIANLLKADAIISVHINSYSVEHVNGATTLYKISDVLAESIQQSIISSTGAKDMGSVKMNDLSILNRAEMEAVIVETGFITNESEAAKLNTPEYQKKMADAIAQGVNDFYNGGN